MCYNMNCFERKVCDKYKKATCIRKMSAAMVKETEKIREIYNIEEELLKRVQEKANKKITIEDLLDRETIEKLRMIS